MLPPNWVTVCTVFGGSVLAAVFYLMARRRQLHWAVPFELWAGLLLNALSVATLLTFIYNVCFAVLWAAMTGSPTPPLQVAGNEAAIFWVLVYATGQAGLSIRRAILSVPAAV